jgi:2-iminobutanoate/2-iminopropanoate deaminase
MARRPAAHDVMISKKAPKPIGPYSQAIRVKSPGEMLFVSGMIPIEVPSGNVFTGDIKKQAEIALSHVKNVVLDAKYQVDDIVKVTVYLTDMKSYDAVNEVYAKLFVGAGLPARVVVAVAGLPKGVGIEVDAVAVKSGGGADDLFSDAELK